MKKLVKIIITTYEIALYKLPFKYKQEDNNYYWKRVPSHYSSLFQSFICGKFSINNNFADANGRLDLKVKIDPVDEFKKKNYLSLIYKFIINKYLTTNVFLDFYLYHVFQKMIEQD